MTEPSPFLRNAWYVAAWEDEIGPDVLFHRRILNEDILLARDDRGVVHGLRNRCPHRFAPLHLGKRRADVVECAYHGLQFNLEGRCVFNPHGDGKIPPGVGVQIYPIAQSQLLVWIWMGEPSLADVNLIPAFKGLDPERFAINKGYMHTPANYEFMSDNIMDLSHIEFIHEGLLGSEAVRRADIEVITEGNVVRSNRMTHNEILTPVLDAAFESGGFPMDRWLDVTWHAPSLMQLVVGAAPSGGTPRVGREQPGVHLMTPETADSTHYFWSNSRDFRRDDAVLHQQIDQGLKYAFENQDKPIIIAQKEAMNGDDFWDLKPLIFAGDAGAIRARRILRKLISAERGSRLET